jgi:nucleoside-diphosphate-sugar epimerase
MKIIVMGCGRVGSQVSLLMASRGHDVTVIDHRDMDAAMRSSQQAQPIMPISSVPALPKIYIRFRGWLRVFLTPAGLRFTNASD